MLNLNFNILLCYVLVQFEAIFESQLSIIKLLLSMVLVISIYCLSINNNIDIIVYQSNIYVLYLFILTTNRIHFNEILNIRFSLYVFDIITIVYYY